MDEAFWAKVRTGPGCWEWVGSRVRSGHGRLQRRGRYSAPIPAHRYSWEQVYGPISDGLLVCHHCDNPPCVRPSHLYLGTALDNSQDMVSRGRHFSPFRGRRNSQAKLTDEQVRTIRQRAMAGERPIQIAKDYPVGRGQIATIIRGEAW